MALDPNDKKIQLGFALADAIYRYTLNRPMVVEDILESLCFTAGHALTQKAAKQFAVEKDLRARCIAALDRGIVEGNRSDGAKIILPSDKGVIIN